MTEPEVTALGPAFASYLRRFRRPLGQDRPARCIHAVPCIRAGYTQTPVTVP